MVGPQKPLAPHLMHLQLIQTSLQRALCHALASCATSPSRQTGILLNVVNHVSLGQYTGVSTNFSAEDLRRLCWLWEWDGKTMKDSDSTEDGSSSLQTPLSSKDWIRGSMGFVVTSATHISKAGRSRVPAYGIGIKVDPFIATGAMTAVARWVAATEMRNLIFRGKLQLWTKVGNDYHNISTLTCSR